MIDFFSTVIYEPLYNTLVYFISVLPGHSLGLAIIVLTIIVKGFLLPLAYKQSRSQLQMKKIEPEMRVLREKYKDDKQEQSRKTMELYQNHGVNPFSGCLLVLIQLPIIISLYFVFLKGIANGIDTSILYSFVPTPEKINFNFLGYYDLLDRSFVLALLAAVTQYVQLKIVTPVQPKPDPDKQKKAEVSFQEEFTRNMSTQMKYGLPIFIFVILYVDIPGFPTLPAAVALYWATSNLFSIAQEMYVRRELNAAPTQK